MHRRSFLISAVHATCLSFGFERSAMACSDGFSIASIPLSTFPGLVETDLEQYLLLKYGNTRILPSPESFQFSVWSNVEDNERFRVVLNVVSPNANTICTGVDIYGGSMGPILKAQNFPDAGTVLGFLLV